MAPLLFADLARASEAVSQTRSRLAKKALFADLLRNVAPSEIGSVVGWLIEEPPGGPAGVGPSQLHDLFTLAAADEPTVLLHEVDAALALARHETSIDARSSRMRALVSRLTPPERRLFGGSLTQSLRQGSAEGVMLLALAEVAGVPEKEVRRALMVKGSLARTAEALLGKSRGDSPPTRLELFSPVAPMLAASAEALSDAISGDKPLRVEWKVDGLRAQLHKEGDRVRVFSRQGNDLSAGVDPIVLAAKAFPATSLVLDGEVVLESSEGRALPFQDTFSAIAQGGVLPKGQNLRGYFFDCLHRDGVDLLDAPLAERALALEAVVPAQSRMPAITTLDVESARAFDELARSKGHEGVMVKDLESAYQAGARGGAWQKVKAFHTVDLVILAVEPGSGRRKGMLSNLHLGARRPDGSFCMVGKTFKGLTDEMLRFQTKRLRELAVEERGGALVVRPELVVEIRFNDVQRSPRYPGGVALRFARVVRYREDKSPAETDLLSDLMALLPESAKASPQLSLFGDT
ncbi:MAG: ATP-dependent DNA ligase [Polyangiaceae bacterium]